MKEHKEQKQFLLYGGNSETFLHVTECHGPIFEHLGYSQPLPYSELSIIDLEKKYSRSLLKFYKVLIEVEEVGVLGCYLLEGEYEYHLKRYLESEIKKNNIKSQKELVNWINSLSLKYNNI
jgi:hypothetical protein